MKFGNSLEVKEAIQVLNGNGPDDLTEVCLKLATFMVSLGNNINEEEALKQVKASIKNKTALEKLKLMVKAQGGNKAWIENTELFPKATINYEVKSNKTGYISRMNTESIGKVSCNLGAGRETKDDEIDYTAGVTILKKTGDFVQTGETIAVLHTNLKERIEKANIDYLEALSIEQNKPENNKLIYEVIN